MSPKHLMAGAIALIVSTGQALPEGELPFDISNRIRIEWDDNIRTSSDNEDDSIKITEDLELLTNIERGNTLVGLRYSPSFTWWADRDEDDTDLHHQFDGSLFHAFSERLSVNLQDTFRLSELPEVIDEGQGTTLRENNDFIYNTVAADVNLGIDESTFAKASASYLLLAYDDDATADLRDYDRFSVGADLTRQVTAPLAVSGQARYSATEYENANRDSDGFQVGGLVRNTFQPGLIGTLRGGWERKSFDAATAGDTDSPYANAQLSYQIAEGTRLNGGLGYSLAEAAIETFANQERFTVFGGISHDITPRITLALDAFASNSSYDGEEADPTAGAVADGEEDFYRISSKVSYMIAARNFVELTYQIADLDSEFSDGERDYTRNRASIGWRTQF